MNKKTNKIILFLGIILILVFFYWSLKVYQKQQKKVSGPVEAPPIEIDLSTYEGKVQFLEKECDLPEGFLMNICRYSPLQKAMSITQNKEIERNKEKTTISVVKFGDLDIFKIDLNQLVANENYKDLSEKLNDNFQLCFEISPQLEKIKVFPEKVFSFNSSNVFCSKLLSKYSLPQLSFIGYIPYPDQDNQEISITSYLVPQDISINDFSSYQNNFFKLTPLVSFVPAIIEK